MKRVYDFPLTDWISTALHKGNLSTALKIVREGEHLEEFLKAKTDNKRYIEKILREESINQFSDNRRPMLELVLNSIDAKPSVYQEDYLIDVHVNSKMFSSADNGKGMSLEDILKFLIIPFNTEKKGVEEIGRFGVGFLSTFNYCLSEPKKVHIIVDTRTGGEGFIVDFYSTGYNVEDLRMRVKRTGKGPVGTKVMIKKSLIKKHITKFLHEHLENMPSYVAKVMMNNRRLNDDSKTKWYVQPVELEVSGKRMQQNVGFRSGKLDFQSKISLTLQGVLVKYFDNGYKNISATVSFPPAVQVVEGRDEFKIDYNYEKCVDAVFKAFESYLDEQIRSIAIGHMPPELEVKTDSCLSEQEKNKKFVRYMTSFVPSLMSALGIINITDIPNLDNIREKLLPGKKYVLSTQEFEEISPFLGGFLEDNAFEVSSYQSKSYWSNVYKSEKDLVNDVLRQVEIFSCKSFKERMKSEESFYPNLHLLADVISDSSYNEVVLVDSPVGESCVFINDIIFKNLYININHPYVSGNLNPSKVYSIISDYFNLPRARTTHGIKKLDDVELKILDLTDRFSSGGYDGL